MAKFEVEVNWRGVEELMRSAEMDAICSASADRVMQQAGEGFAKHKYVGERRLSYTITPDSIEASKRNKKHNVLLKALGAGKV